MALRVDCQAALDWLGIQGYRPTGRVVLPERVVPVENDPIPAKPNPREAARPEPLPEAPQAETAPAVSPDDGPDRDLPEPTPGEALDDAVLLAGGSAHRDLGRAVARVGGLPCREAGETDEGVRLEGRVQPFAELTGGADAKRRLWKALVRRTRRRA